MKKGLQDLADRHYNLWLPCRGYPMGIQCKVLELIMELTFQKILGLNR